MAAIEKSRKVDPIDLIFALCIPNIGADAGKKLIAALGTKGFLSRIESGEGFEDVDGIGVERSNALLNWFADDENKNLFDRLMAELTLEDVVPKQEADGTCIGLSFVITGDVHLFKNRSAFKAYVEQQGGAVTGSVSGEDNVPRQQRRGIEFVEDEKGKGTGGSYSCRGRICLSVRRSRIC